MASVPQLRQADAARANDSRASDAPASDSRASDSRALRMMKAGGWALAAWLVLLAVFAVNGAPLFYFDTAGYFDTGTKMLHVLGLFPPEGVGGVTGAAEAAPDGTVVGSRSAVYALIAATFLHLDALPALVLLQAALLVLALHLVCRLVLAQTGGAAQTGRVALAWPATAAAALAGALGSAGFFTAYLMPDIFAALLLLSMAGLAAFAPDLRGGSALALLALGALSVVLHLSHLAIALMAVPGVALACLAFGNRRWWLSVLLVALIAATGLVERRAFTFTVETTTNEHVIYLPFFTARLIADGPGKAYLDATCPKAGADATVVAHAMATCALNEKLVRPEQLAPDRILFATSPEFGSYALLSAGQRRRISDEQRAFLQAVVTSRPLEVIAAALGHTFAQVGLVSIDMTLASPQMAESARRIYPGFPDSLTQGRLTGENPTGEHLMAENLMAENLMGGNWVVPLTRLHEVYYALSGLALLALLVLPQSRLPRRLRLFGVLVLLGIFANAFVTGAIAQPANRYGARVIFLIPVVLVLLLMARPVVRPVASPVAHPVASPGKEIRP